MQAARTHDGDPSPHLESRCLSLRTQVADNYLLIVIVSIFYLLTIANYGFFSHDEWQVYDFTSSRGLWSYVETFGRVYAGSSLGTPVRPIGFIQQALLSFWMQNTPVVPHTFSVGLHVFVALTFVTFLRSAGMNRFRALVAALLFGLSPLAVFATGWTAACFDQWYSLFALSAGCAIVAIGHSGFRIANVTALVGASAAAILSKETAMILPAAAWLFAVSLDICHGRPIAWRRACLIGVLTAIPVALYLGVRFPAVLATLHGQGGPYAPSISLIPRNAALYFAFPLLVQVSEMQSALSMPVSQVISPLLIHCLLVAAIVWRFGWLRAGLYIAAYFMFLMPVISLPGLGSHYLYASAFALSVAVASVILDDSGRFRAGATTLLAAAGAVGMTFHGLLIQKELYVDGRCQRTFLASLDSQLAGIPAPGSVVILPASTSRWWVAVRAVHDRQTYARVKLIDTAAGVASNFTMDVGCHVVSTVGPS